MSSSPAGAGARRRILASVLAGTFIGTLNNSVANVAVLDVLDDFHVDLGAGVWFVTGYVLAFAVLMPAAGRLVDAFGTRRVYLTGLAGFAVASLLVAVAPTYPTAAAARVVQGMVNAPVLPTVMVTLGVAFPLQERGRAMGLWASVNGAAIALGPPLGGVLTEAFGWRAIFWLDVPMALAALLLAARHLPDSPRRPAGPLDAAGGAAFTGGLVAVMVALSQAGSWGWNRPATLGLLAAGLASLAWMVRRSRRVASPFLDVGLVRNRRYAVLAAVAALQMVVLFGVLFSVPLLLVSLFHQSVGTAGALAFVLPVTMVVAGPSMGALSDRYGPRALTGAGAVLLASAAAVLVAGVDLHQLVLLLAGLIVLGGGVSAIQSPAAARVADEVEANRGVALGLFHTLRFLAGVLGTAAAAAVFTAVAGSAAVDRVPVHRLEAAFRATFVGAGVVALLAAAVTRMVPTPPRVALAARLEPARSGGSS